MARRLFTLAAAVSLVLCAGTVALWILSYQRDVSWEFDRRQGRWRAIASRGDLRFDNKPQRQLDRELWSQATDHFIHATDTFFLELARSGSSPAANAAEAELDEALRISDEADRVFARHRS